MITSINWIQIEWTPQEIFDFIQISTPKDKVPINNIEHIRPCWPRAITPSIKTRWNRNPHWNKWQKIWTISLINWTRVEYKNQAVLAKVLWVDPWKISRVKNTSKAINWFYVTTKHQ